jgi:hypothetical protein
VFTVTVDYAGMPSVVTDPDGSIEGWVPTGDGAYVVGEPQGSPGWYPVNDPPGQGDLRPPGHRPGRAHGHEQRRAGVADHPPGGDDVRVAGAGPMAPYLATATLGRFDLTRSRLGRLPV